MIVDSKKNKIQKLNKLRQKILNNIELKILKDQANNLVLGDGNLNADIFLIGEAPGKSEDILGKPFVGASGKFLNRMLEEAGLSRDEVYITNIVKYRPPKNRDPNKNEKKIFLPYLLEELKIISPKIVITLGRHSMEYFLPNEKISEVHGRIYNKIIKLENNLIIKYIPLFHPAAALYNRSLREVLVGDFIKIIKNL